MEDEISAMFIENNSKELSKNKLSFWEKRTSNGTIENEIKVNKLCQNCSIQQRTKKHKQSFVWQGEIKLPLDERLEY